MHYIISVGDDVLPFDGGRKNAGGYHRFAVHVQNGHRISVFVVAKTDVDNFSAYSHLRPKKLLMSSVLSVISHGK